MLNFLFVHVVVPTAEVILVGLSLLFWVGVLYLAKFYVKQLWSERKRD